MLYLLFVLAKSLVGPTFWLAPVLLVWPQHNSRNHPAWNPNKTVFQALARSWRVRNCVVWICYGYTTEKVTSKVSWLLKKLLCKSDNSSCTCRRYSDFSWDEMPPGLACFCIQVFFVWVGWGVLRVWGLLSLQAVKLSLFPYLLLEVAKNRLLTRTKSPKAMFIC